MSISSYVDIIAPASSVVIGVAVKILVNWLHGKTNPPKPHAERLRELMKQLETASSQVDLVIKELSNEATERTTTLEKLESNLKELEKDEVELLKRVEALKAVPVESVKYLLESLQPSERRNKYRDYILFSSGIVLTTIIAYLLK